MDCYTTKHRLQRTTKLNFLNVDKPDIIPLYVSQQVGNFEMGVDFGEVPPSSTLIVPPPAPVKTGGWGGIVTQYACVNCKPPHHAAPVGTGGGGDWTKLYYRLQKILRSDLNI